MQVQLSVPSSILNGKTTVVTAGTRVVLGNLPSTSVTIKALAINSGLIYVGNSSVSNANGFQLSPGDTVSLDIDNLNKIFLDADNSNMSVTYIAIY